VLHPQTDEDVDLAALVAISIPDRGASTAVGIADVPGGQKVVGPHVVVHDLDPGIPKRRRVAAAVGERPADRDLDRIAGVGLDAAIGDRQLAERLVALVVGL
jgi:hypothetical protein